MVIPEKTELFSAVQFDTHCFQTIGLGGRKAILFPTRAGQIKTMDWLPPLISLNNRKRIGHGYVCLNQNIREIVIGSQVCIT